MEYYDPMLERYKQEKRKLHQIIDYKCLRKYDQRNEHFSMKAITINENEKEKLIGYNCIYRYNTHEIKLEYRILTQKWTLINDKYNSEEEEKQLNKTIDFNNQFPWVDMGYPLDKRIQLILKRFDDYFFELNQLEEVKQNKNNMSKSSPVSKTDNELTELSSSDKSPSSTNIEDSNCLEKNVINNSFQRFVPPSTTLVHKRRVIESIYLRVQRKKNIFENIVDLLYGTKSPTMYQLGLEFLSVYDGKFNYPEGYTFVMCFRKKTWFLTIEKIKYVVCQLGQFEPQSVLILNYKNQLTAVHV